MHLITRLVNPLSQSRKVPWRWPCVKRRAERISKRPPNPTESIATTLRSQNQPSAPCTSKPRGQRIVQPAAEFRSHHIHVRKLIIISSCVLYLCSVLIDVSKIIINRLRLFQNNQCLRTLKLFSLANGSVCHDESNVCGLR